MGEGLQPSGHWHRTGKAPFWRGQKEVRIMQRSTMPDIRLLPELSVLLGVTIDALFAMTDESCMTRI